ncbi:hypothetical protein PFISCL1PPCAC_27734, partial [Pristionchus fissidentatus]
RGHIRFTLCSARTLSVRVSVESLGTLASWFPAHKEACNPIPLSAFSLAQGRALVELFIFLARWLFRDRRRRYLFLFAISSAHTLSIRVT